MRKILILLALGLNYFSTYASDVVLKAGKSSEPELQTAKIQRAIDKVSRSGGGTVTLCGGVFLTAPIELKSGVNLCIAENATLLGSPRLADYKDRPRTRHFRTEALPRWRNIALIYADEAENISITGKGTIDCNGHNFVKAKTGEDWTGWWYERTAPVRESVPRAVFFAGCRNVRVEDVKLVNLPAGWGYWVHDCDNVIFSGCRISADVHYPNNDGIHINCSRDVLVENCDIKTGDDAIVLRANSRSLKENKVCERVTVRNCRLCSWSSAIRLGWTGDGVIRNCTVSDIEMYDCSNGISCFLPAFKYIEASNDYGREATLVENISFDNIRMDKIYGSPIYVKVADSEETKFEAFRNVTFSNISCHALEKPFFNDRSGGGKDVKFSGCNFTIDSVSDYPENAGRHGYVGRPKEKYHEPWHVCAFV
ncbi:MAG: glycosyl hydrolase family 28 protein, partial [Bacteroidales bacterium]|nr:glycosyl hydrolase family 28 protein [Bacteroidales bacterium]